MSGLDLARIQFGATAALLAGIVATALPVVAVGLANYPAVLISSVDPNGTVTVNSGAAGADALRLLTVAAAPLVPVLFAVQAACWWIFRRRSDRGAPQTLYW